MRDGLRLAPTWLLEKKVVFLITRSQLITMRLAAAKLTRFENSESRMINLCPVSLSTGPGRDSSVV